MQRQAAWNAFRTLRSSGRLRSILIGLVVYVLDAWILGSFTVTFKDAQLGLAMFHNPLYAAVVFPFQGTIPAWIVLNLVVGVLGGLTYLKVRAALPETFLPKKKEPEFVDDPSCGTARWLTKEEAKNPDPGGEKLLDFGHGPGILFGACEGEPVRLHSADRNQNVMVYGAPGCRKTRGLVIPNMLQAVETGCSLINTDPKGEIHRATIPFFEQQGYKVGIFNLIDMLRSHRWNPLAELKDDLDAQLFADVVIANTTAPGIRKMSGDPFWSRAEQNLIKALTLYTIKEYPKEKANPGTLYTLLSGKGLTELDIIFDSLPAEHPAKPPYNIFSQADKPVKTGVIQGLGVRLQVFANENVKRLTETSDLDLELPGKEKCVYYCVMSDKDTTFSFIASLFFSFLFIKLMSLADSCCGPCPVPVRFIFDEFCNIGQIPDFSKKIATVRSRGLSLMMIVQSLPQLKNRYPNEEWEEIIGCCDSQLVFGVNDNQTAKYISDRLGIGTVQKIAARNKAMSLDMAQVMHSTSQRRLLNPDEIQALNRNKAVLILGGYPPLLIDKLDYTQHPLGHALPARLDGRTADRFQELKAAVRPPMNRGAALPEGPQASPEIPGDPGEVAVILPDIPGKQETPSPEPQEPHKGGDQPAEPCKDGTPGEGPVIESAQGRNATEQDATEESKALDQKQTLPDREPPEVFWS